MDREECAVLDGDALATACGSDVALTEPTLSSAVCEFPAPTDVTPAQVIEALAAL